MKIQFIIDNPHGNKFTLTQTRDGEVEVISRDRAKQMHNSFIWQDSVFFTAKAEVQVQAVEQHEA